MDSRRAVILGSIMLALCSWNPAKADIRYVDWSATGSESGESWEDAYTSLAAALARFHSSDLVDEIWVREGLYRASETDINASFQLQRLVSIYGGFEGTEENRSDRDPVAHET